MHRVRGFRRRLTGVVFRALFFVVVAAGAHAHEVDQMYADLRVEGRSWELEILFDAAYALPEMRADREAPAPPRSWLTGLPASEHERIRSGVREVLSEELRLAWSGEALPYQLSYPDFTEDPPDFPVMRMDLAFTRVLMHGELPAGAGDLEAGVAEGTGPNYVLAVSDGGLEPRYLNVTPGSVETCLVFAAGGDGIVQGEGALMLGFRHVVPDGWDHALFILGLFLARRNWRSLIAQSLVFTLAHSVTLGLVLSGWANVPAQPVEVVIALSIAAVAFWNLRGEHVGAGRLVLVFVFGLVHGLGFAGALSERLASVGIVDLLLANLGIELAQVAVLAAAWVVTLGWWRGEAYAWFRIAASLAIASVGLWWAFQRM